jgi:YbgC/YbaW family acyl-CoA thioester hydrolase
MSKYFTKTFRVGWSEMNAIGQVHISEYFRYVIETAWDWGAAIGLGIAENEALGLAWVIRETEIHLRRPLRPHDVFDLTIWLIDWRRVRGRRCFELVLRDGGEIVAQGTQEVVVLDSGTLRPVAPPEDIIANLKIENPRLIPHQKIPRLQDQPKAAFVARRVVELRDLDSQEHVNNANYASFAEDVAAGALAAMGWSPAHFKDQGLVVVNRRVHIQYQSPASWGETLDVAAHLLELGLAGGVWYIDVRRAADREPIAQCVLDWALANRTSGEGQKLPQSLADALKQRMVVPENNPPPPGLQ